MGGVHIEIMKSPLLFALPGNEGLTASLARTLGWETGAMTARRFPDGESYLRYLTPLSGREVVLVCTLDRPDDKLIALYLAARTARDLGAARIGLVAPYLAYMRQDKVFHDGEGVTSHHIAALLASVLDWMVTVDPHLHRIHDLGEIYPIATQVVHAAPAISRWIGENVPNPLVIGPDGESEQWAAAVANGAGCPYTVLQKTRRGDHDVEVSVPDVGRWQGRTPVLVDDIASTARTMMAAVAHLKAAALPPPVCAVVHPVFAGDAFEALQSAGVARIVACNTIAHGCADIDIADALAQAMRLLSGRG